MSPLRWTTKSLRHLAEQLSRQGHPVSAPTVGRLLRDNGFSLQGTAKTLEGVTAPRSRRPVHLHQRAGQGPPGRRRAGDQRRCEEEGAARAATGGRAGVAAEGRPGPGRGPQLLHRRPGRAAGRPVRRLRPHRRRRLGERRRRPRHLRVRRRLDPPLVAGPWGRRLSGCAQAADHRGRGRLQQLPLPVVEGRAGRIGGRDRAGRSPSATSRPAPASGTRSSTGCSPRSP